MYGLIDAMKCSAHLMVAMWKSLVPFMTVVRLLLFAGRNNSGQAFSEHGSVGPRFRLFDGIARCCRRGVGGARLGFFRRAKYPRDDARSWSCVGFCLSPPFRDFRALCF